MELPLRAMECQLPYEITPATWHKWVHPALTPVRQPSARFTYAGWWKAEWLGTYRDGLPVSRQSPIQVVTGPDVEQLEHYTMLPAICLSV